MKKINVEAIQQRLFEAPIRCRIISDYRLRDDINTPQEFAAALSAAMEQSVVAEPLKTKHDDKVVFKAAVRALGSNSRQWRTYLACEPHLMELLGGCDPKITCNKHLKARDVANFLPGQTGTRDGEAILKWACNLQKRPNYYEYLCAIGNDFFKKSQLHEIPTSELMLCIVAHLAAPPIHWKCDALPKWNNLTRDQRKTPGMSYILASEFMRNLGWNGFKPDRHVKRLFDNWFPCLLNDGIPDFVRGKVQSLQERIGNQTRELKDYLRYSLVGIDTTPPEYQANLSKIDNLVWALGSYVRNAEEDKNLFPV